MSYSASGVSSNPPGKCDVSAAAPKVSAGGKCAGPECKWLIAKLNKIYYIDRDNFGILISLSEIPNN